MTLQMTHMPNKRNLSDSSDPQSPDPNINKKKKLFITKNRYELLQVEPQITQNLTTETQNSTSETPNCQSKLSKMSIQSNHHHQFFELELRLFEVRKVTNVLHKSSKSPLPLFFVDLKPTDHSNDIFKLSSFLHTKIKVEEPYKPKIISQCLNCQDYGHTRAYCRYPARCVRCSAFHPSSECTKTRETAAKCALCSGNHPANYRGCSVYKELQRRKTPTTKSNFLYDNIKHNVNNNNVKANHPLPTSFGNNSAASSKTYAQATSSQPSQSSPSTPPPSDLTVTISSFVDELNCPTMVSEEKRYPYGVFLLFIKCSIRFSFLN
ncbi:hypothetical protein AGLY_008470 [Aphis glycines]|uniref:Pre-C2HC domain-containing protein n=1 Tax=Aphis glycines TaxID=307491 RepID=A0A6G0TKQ0_APHGL|nr:hypothetical protein AGLY_008470 [Aphis glycines]